MRALVTCAVLLALVTAAASSAATHDGPQYIEPAWSPNGKLIAFVDGGVGGNLSDLWVMNADGTNPHKLTNGRYVRGPTWSPDSKRIAFGYGYGQYGTPTDAIAVLNANGTGLHEIAHPGAGPDWSPGGRKIAFATGSAEDPWKVYVVNPDGAKQAVVAADRTSGCSLAEPAWSPDGQRMAFRVTGAECYQGIGMVSQYSGRIRSLVTNRIGADLDWSPGGRRIAYSWFDTDPAKETISVIDLKTGRRTRLHAGSHPSWSPNSRRIVFSDEASIYVMSADGTEVSKLYPR